MLRIYSGLYIQELVLLVLRKPDVMGASKRVCKGKVSYPLYYHLTLVLLMTS